jgi:outer membrane protein assembly factor BamA
VVLLAVAACGGSEGTRVHHKGDEYLKAIRVEGNHAISSGDLIPGLAMARVVARQGAIDDYQLKIDTQRIATAYEKLGFFSAKIEPKIEKEGDAATIVFEITEGPRAKVTIEIDGLPPEVPMDKARAQLELKDGDPFDYDKYDEAKAPLHRLVEDAGYAHVELDAAVIASRGASTATVRYVFDPGPRCMFGAVTISGAEGMLADSVKMRIAFRTGAPFSATALDTTRDDLYTSGLFGSVRVDAEHDVDGTVIPVKITVGHGDLNDLRFGFGGGVDPLAKFGRLRLSYTRQRFLTPRTTLAADLRPELALENCDFDLQNCTPQFRGRTSVNLTQQDLFHRDVKGDVEVGYDYLIIEAYTLYGPRTGLGVTVPLHKRLQLRLGWQYSYTQFRDFNIGQAEQTSLHVDHPNSVGAYSATLTLDLRDRKLEPHSGILLDVRGAVGTPLAAGTFSYTEVIPDVRAFYSIGETTFAVRTRVGLIDGDVPAIERFYAGGFSSHRGFSYRNLSPVAQGTHIVIGGAALMVSSFEVRRPVATLPWYGLQLVGVGFVDAGNVTNTVSELDPAKLDVATGVALGILTPIGPLGLYLARRVNRTGPEDAEPWYSWGIALGEAF